MIFVSHHALILEHSSKPVQNFFEMVVSFLALVMCAKDGRESNRLLQASTQKAASFGRFSRPLIRMMFGLVILVDANKRAWDEWPCKGIGPETPSDGVQILLCTSPAFGLGSELGSSVAASQVEINLSLVVPWGQNFCFLDCSGKHGVISRSWREIPQVPKDKGTCWFRSNRNWWQGVNNVGNYVVNYILLLVCF